MAYLIDTNIAIALRDGDLVVTDRIGRLDGAVLMSIVTRVELEGGVHRVSADAALRRARLDVVLQSIPTLAFDDSAAAAYGQICAAVGYSRRKLLDRMIAAQALMHRATLITRNAADFADVDGLAIEEW